MASTQVPWPFHAVVPGDSDGPSGRRKLYADVVAAGSPGRQPPYDAFWGSRFAIVEDPDENLVGLMSPSDGPKGAPPSAPPSTAAPPRDRAFGVTHLPVPESFFDHSPESELVAWE